MQLLLTGILILFIVVILISGILIYVNCDLGKSNHKLNFTNIDSDIDTRKTIIKNNIIEQNKNLIKQYLKKWIPI